MIFASYFKPYTLIIVIFNALPISENNQLKSNFLPVKPVF